MSFEEFTNQFYKSKEWRKIRAEVIKRDMGVCQMHGGIIKRYPNVDHIIEITKDNYTDKSITHSLDNLQTLCIPCHNRKTKQDKVNAKNRTLKGTSLEVDYEKRIDWSK